MKALVYERNPVKFAATAAASKVRPGVGARVGPLRLTDVSEPDLPGEGWHRITTRMSGICGSDLATIDAKSSRYFEPLVSFPFVMGHEAVGELEDGAVVPFEILIEQRSGTAYSLGRARWMPDGGFRGFATSPAATGWRPWAWGEAWLV